MPLQALPNADREQISVRTSRRNDYSTTRSCQNLVTLADAQDILLSYQPRASVLPASLDLTKDPFMWPFHKQPLYAGAMPTMFNATVLNGMSLTGNQWLILQHRCYWSAWPHQGKALRWAVSTCLNQYLGVPGCWAGLHPAKVWLCFLFSVLITGVGPCRSFP